MTSTPLEAVDPEAVDPDAIDPDEVPDGDADHSEPAPEWTEDDDWTGEALALLRTLRAPHRRSRAGQIGFTVYCTLLILVVWGVTPSFGLFLQSSMGADYTGNGPALLAALPSGIAAVALATLLFAARDGLWRGPVIPPRATADWLLPQPVRPGRVLRPWFWLSGALAVAPGIVAAAAGMVALGLTVKTGLFAAFGWCLLGGVCLPLLATCAGLAVELDDRVAALVRRLTPLLTVVVLLLVAQSALAVQGHRVPWLERVELWSGPWGWAGLAALAPTPAAQPGAWVAAGLLLLLTGVCAWYADRSCGNIQPARLRERARTAAGVLAALRTVELRAARLAVTSAAPGAGPRRLLSLPAPRAAWQVVPWRDALALLRSPARLGRSLLLAVPAMVCAFLVHSSSGAVSWAGTALALVFGYLAVAQLLEPARIETDDLRRASWSPYPFPELMLRHAIVPTVLGVLLGSVCALVALLSGGGAEAWLAPAAVPALVGAGLVNACRGVVRQDLMVGSSPTPGSGIGPFLFAAWYAAGPAVAVIVLTVPFTKAFTGGSAAATLTAVLWCVAVAAVLLWWARERAAKLTPRGRSGGTATAPAAR
ncbi:DUF6297 family protein [Kitasatospora sp. MAP5-34]|uniref:DUF6297 family protein n=1 Tax=Kitasatospora sp. MAP5-34 TaxID=3035102 RepID=UPI0024756791|nr:DUF6297 family protein [Kitasatospora sp. MAP5-34]MDH6576907.1 hypothetical protein [Kitasatospora sp. MAP5-34]